jgi:hypothetical protein
MLHMDSSKTAVQASTLRGTVHAAYGFQQHCSAGLYFERYSACCIWILARLQCRPASWSTTDFTKVYINF